MGILVTKIRGVSCDVPLWVFHESRRRVAAIVLETDNFFFIFFFFSMRAERRSIMTQLQLRQTGEETQLAGRIDWKVFA